MTVREFTNFILNNFDSDDTIVVYSKNKDKIISGVISIQRVYLGTKELPLVMISDGENDD